MSLYSFGASVRAFKVTQAIQFNIRHIGACEIQCIADRLWKLRPSVN